MDKVNDNAADVDIGRARSQDICRAQEWTRVRPGVTEMRAGMATEVRDCFVAALLAMTPIGVGS